MARSFTKIAAFAFVLVFTFALARTSMAQDDNKDIIRPLTAKGSAAFMFTIQGLAPFSIGAPGVGTVTLRQNVTQTLNGVTTSFLVETPVQLSGAGMKYFISDDMALRFALAFGTTSSGVDTISPGKVSATAFGIAAGIEEHMRPLYSTSPYVGAQVSFASGSSTITTLQGKTDVDDKISSSDFGIGVFGGFDWFFTRGIAIGAEVSLGFDSQSSSETAGSPATTTDHPSTTTIALATGASAHVVVYF